MYNSESVPYKKKAVHKPSIKSKHKHEYQPCIFEYEGVQFDKTHGFLPKQESTIGSYCPLCGKIGLVNIEKWMQWVPMQENGSFGRFEYTEEALRELAPETRTFRTFHLKDGRFQKFIAPEELFPSVEGPLPEAHGAP